MVRLAEEKFAALPHGPRAAGRAGALSRRRSRGSTEDLEQVHVDLCLSRRRQCRSGYLHRAGLCHGAGRRHVLAPVPGSAREARALLFDLCLLPLLHRWRDDRHLCRHGRKRSGARLSAVVAGEMAALAETASAEEVARAKAQLRSGLLMGLERPSARAEQIAGQLLAYGRVLPIAELDRQARRRGCDRRAPLRRAHDGGRRRRRWRRSARSASSKPMPPSPAVSARSRRAAE